MKKRYKILILILAIFVFAFFYGKTGGEQNNKTKVKIGVIAPLTGDVAYLGEVYALATQLAVSEAKKTNLKYDYEIVIEDDAVQTKKTALAYNKLVHIDKVKSLVSFTAGSGNVVAPLTSKDKVPHIAITSDPNVAVGDYNFVHWTQPDKEADKFIEEANTRGIKRIAVIALKHPGAYAIIDVLKEKLKTTDIKITSIDYVNPGIRDFKTIISKAEINKPELYFLQFYPPEINIAYKQLRELNVKTEVAGMEILAILSDKDRAMFEGAWNVDAAEAKPEFEKLFKKETGNNLGIGCPNAFDAVNIIIKAYEEIGDGVTIPASQNIAYYISNLKNYDSVLGKISIDENDIFQSEAVVKKIKDGKLEVVK